MFEITMFITTVRNRYLTRNVKVTWLVSMVLVHPIIAVV
jgi:hypothetical protein